MTSPTEMPMRRSCVMYSLLTAMTFTLPVALTRTDAMAAEVYKCIAPGGHVTYQQAPCSGDQRGSAVELEESVVVPAPGDDQRWATAARDRQVTVGMPKPFVTAALGRPAEIRAPREGEPGSEVWVYPRPEATMRIGFTNNAVAWIRSDTRKLQASVAGEGASTPGADGERETRVRDALAVGKPCDAVLQEAGTPDREERLVAGSATGARYVYQFDAKNANAYSAFVCLGGRVTSVERYTPEARPGT